MKVGEKIKTAREMKKLSQEDMAEKLGLAVHTYGRLERGESRIYIQLLEEIAQVLEMDIADLFSIGEKKLLVVIGENGTATESVQTINNCSFDKETVMALLKAKDEVIEQQKQSIELLKNMLEMIKSNTQ